MLIDLNTSDDLIEYNLSILKKLQGSEDDYIR